MLTDKEWGYHSMQLTVRSLLCSIKPFLCLLESTRPNWAELLTLLLDVNAFQNLYKTDTSLRRTLSVLRGVPRDGRLKRFYCIRFAYLPGERRYSSCRTSLQHYAYLIWMSFFKWTLHTPLRFEVGDLYCINIFAYFKILMHVRYRKNSKTGNILTCLSSPCLFSITSSDRTSRPPSWNTSTHRRMKMLDSSNHSKACHAR